MLSVNKVIKKFSGKICKFVSHLIHSRSACSIPISLTSPPVKSSHSHPHTALYQEYICRLRPRSTVHSHSHLIHSRSACSIPISLTSPPVKSSHSHPHTALYQEYICRLRPRSTVHSHSHLIHSRSACSIPIFRSLLALVSACRFLCNLS